MFRAKPPWLNYGLLFDFQVPLPNILASTEKFGPLKFLYRWLTLLTWVNAKTNEHLSTSAYKNQLVTEPHIHELVHSFLESSQFLGKTSGF